MLVHLVLQVGFRFAPKLHGILTKAQAVLQVGSDNNEHYWLWSCDKSVSVIEGQGIQAILFGFR